ncbi:MULTISPECIES: DUF6201 family protein [Snodgrassella]|uniref:DUF6201 family protein n=1 Tax=Snodgrassella TaxID=1193515 RepID=UPI0009972E2D|nr:MULTISPECIES: DUF6201 family protein [Snodgrassella]OOX78686.1 hypothetical protein BGH94_07490 [Snodgrassella alvi]ORF00489.1 hypothetical protein BGH95_08440 [Snodgrassella alvi]
MKHNIHIFFKNILRKNAVFKKNILVLIMVLWWWFFSSSSFYGDFNLCDTINGLDGEYYINVYEHLPTTPLAVYELIQGNRYFYVLYNKQGKKIWHSPHYAYLYDNVSPLFIPTKDSKLLRYSEEDWSDADIKNKIKEVYGDIEHNQH